MIKICSEEIEKIRGLAIPWPENWTLEDRWDSGVKSKKISTPSEELLLVDDVVGRIKAKEYYIATDCTGGIEVSKLLIFKHRLDEKNNKVTILYDKSYGFGVNFMFLGPIKEKEQWILESKEEVELFLKSKEWQKLKTQLSDVDKFLSDPWEEYRGKEKRFKEQLEKAEAATKHKIEQKKKEKADLEKEIADLEAELLGNYLGI